MFNGADKRNEQTGSIKIKGVDNVKLTARQQMFVEYYLQTGCRNSAEAIRHAGYTGNNPYVAASVMLRRPNVKKYLHQRKKHMMQEAGINAYNVLIEIATIAFSDIRELYNADGTLKNIKDLSKGAAAVLEAVEVDEIFSAEGDFKGYTKKVKMQSKLKALELLMRYLGILDKDKDGNNPINLNNVNVTLDLGGGNVLKLPVNGTEK